MLKEFRLVEPLLDQLFPNSLIESPILAKYLDYMKTVDGFNLEYTKKVDKNIISDSRLNMLFGKNMEKRCSEIIMFIDKLNAENDYRFNTTAISNFLKKANQEKMTLCGLGIDLRENTSESRIKVYLEYERSPNLIYDLLMEFDYTDHLLNLTLNNDVMVGFDLYEDNQVCYKTYLRYDKYRNNKLMNLKFKTYLGDKVYDIISRSPLFFLTCRQDNKFVYMPTFYDPKSFLRTLNLSHISEDSLLSNGCIPYGVALLTDEIDKGKITHMNLYYEIYNWRTQEVFRQAF